MQSMSQQENSEGMTKEEIAKILNKKLHEVTDKDIETANAMDQVLDEVILAVRKDLARMEKKHNKRVWKQVTEGEVFIESDLTEPMNAIPSRPLITQPTSTIEHRGNSTRKHVIVDTLKKDNDVLQVLLLAIAAGCIGFIIGYWILGYWLGL